MTAPQTTDTSRVQRRTLVVLVVSQIVGTVGIGVAPTIGVLLAEQVTANPSWAGLARVASTLGAAVSACRSEGSRPAGDAAAH